MIRSLFKSSLRGRSLFCQLPIIHQQHRSMARQSKRQKVKAFLGLDDDPTGGFQVGEELDNIESMTSVDNRLLNYDVEKQAKRLKTIMMKKIIERKYFKPEQEVNLLTWDAKEQIRYLHNEYPDIWTLEKLTQSYPVSRDGIIKLLKSRWRPRTLKDLLKHDKRVQRNWSSLKASGQKLIHDGPITSRYERLLGEGKLELIAHADGIPALPQPEQKLLPLEPETPVKTDGKFAAIVKKYCEQQQEKNEKTHRDIGVIETKLNEHKKAKQLLIGDIVTSSLNSEGFQINVKAVQSELEKHFQTEKKQMAKKKKDNISAFQSASLTDEHIEPEFFSNQDTANIRASDEFGNREYEIATVDDPQYEQIYLNEMRSKYGNSKEKQDLLDKIQFDEDKSASYMFSPETGYQFPLGTVAKFQLKVDIKDCEKQGSGVYRKGKCFYDENGEFIYKLP